MEKSNRVIQTGQYALILGAEQPTSCWSVLFSFFFFPVLNVVWCMHSPYTVMTFPQYNQREKWTRIPEKKGKRAKRHRINKCIHQKCIWHWKKTCIVQQRADKIVLSLLASRELWLMAPSIQAPLSSSSLAIWQPTQGPQHQAHIQSSPVEPSILYLKSIRKYTVLFSLKNFPDSRIPFPNFAPEHEIGDAGHAPSQKTKEWVRFSQPLAHITQLTGVTAPTTKTFFVRAKKFKKYS